MKEIQEKVQCHPCHFVSVVARKLLHVLKTAKFVNKKHLSIINDKYFSEPSDLKNKTVNLSFFYSTLWYFSSLKFKILLDKLLKNIIIKKVSFDTIEDFYGSYPFVKILSYLFIVQQYLNWHSYFPQKLSSHTYFSIYPCDTEKLSSSKLFNNL